MQMTRKMDEFNTGLKLACATLSTTAILDVLTWNDVVKLQEIPNGKELYIQGWIANTINNMLIGPGTYTLVRAKLTSTSNHSFFLSLRNSLEMVLWHAVFYYAFHRLMHTARLYKIHKFHHQFNKVILASTANAVSIREYVFAYMLPFILGCIIVSPNEHELLVSASIVSLFNLIVHTPSFKGLKLPWFMVSTADHFDHHTLQKRNFAAPTFHIDNLLQELFLLKR